MRTHNLHSINILGSFFFFLVLSLFVAEQISSYHFPVGENIEVTDSEEGEQEKEVDEKEKKEFFQEDFDLSISRIQAKISEKDNSFLKLLIMHKEVHTPPPKS